MSEQTVSQQSEGGVGKRKLTWVLCGIIAVELILLGIKLVPKITARFQTDSEAVQSKTDPPSDKPSDNVSEKNGGAESKNGGPKKPAQGKPRKPDNNTKPEAAVKKNDSSQKQPAGASSSQDSRPERTAAAGERTGRGPGRRPAGGNRGPGGGGMPMKMGPEQVDRMLGRFTPEDLVRRGRMMLTRIPAGEDVKKLILERISEKEDLLLAAREGETPEKRKKRIQGMIDDPSFPEEFRDKARSVLAGIKTDGGKTAEQKPETEQIKPRSYNRSLQNTDSPMVAVKQNDEDLLSFKGYSLSPEGTAADNMKKEDADNLYAWLMSVSGTIKDGLSPEAGSGDTASYSPEVQTQIKRIQTYLGTSRELFVRAASLIRQEAEKNNGMAVSFYTRNDIQQVFVSSAVTNSSYSLYDIDARYFNQLNLKHDEIAALGVYYLLRDNLYANLNNSFYFLKKSGLKQNDPLFFMFVRKQDEKVSGIVGELELLRNKDNVEEAESE